MVNQIKAECHLFTSGQDRVSLVWGLPAAVAKNLVDGRVNNAVDLQSVADTLKALLHRRVVWVLAMRLNPAERLTWKNVFL